MNATNDAQFDARFQQYRGELEDLTLFRYAEQSHAGRRGSAWMKALDRETAEAVTAVGEMMQSHRTLLDVGLAIIRGMNPHASRAEWSAALFRNAADALRREYDDVERRSGPEVGRLKDYVRSYTLGEKLVVLETLFTIAGEFIGHGWAAQRLAAELGVLLPGKAT